MAAINAGGNNTFFFSAAISPSVPYQYINDTANDNSPSYKLSREKMNIIKSLDLLVIDEISMVRLIFLMQWMLF